MAHANALARPCDGLKTERMAGHWVLARAGKRVLRPGGFGLTRQMLASLDVDEFDDVVEFAPGLGVTARLALAAQPASYTGVERDERAASVVRNYLAGETQRCVVANAERTGLPEGSASVVYGEAMLTMQTAETKRRIISEARRLLGDGGRYAIHELCLTPDGIDDEVRAAIERELSRVVHVGVRPLTAVEWRALLEAHGFEIQTAIEAPMRLLEPARVVRDEGLLGAIRFAFNVLRDPDVRSRVRAMRRVFRSHAPHLTAITLVAVKR